jgi:mediator of RNA polymerase II transcription subunit 13
LNNTNLQNLSKLTNNLTDKPGNNVGLANNPSTSIMQQPHQQQCNVLYVAYCLSEDQRYLLTSCCDENGELVESTSISIEIDERTRRRENHARRIGLRKLWEFIIAIISQTCKPWRLVIGRLGRIGHSEIKGWGCLLSKKNLQRVCAQLKESCETCNVLGILHLVLI